MTLIAAFRIRVAVLFEEQALLPLAGLQLI